MTHRTRIINTLSRAFNNGEKQLNSVLLRTTGARILAIRKDMGLTQPEFALKMAETWRELKRQGVPGEFSRPSTTTVSEWETGRTQVSPQAIIIIAEMWKTTTDFLLCAPWTISEHRPGDNNNHQVYWHPEVDVAAATLDALEPGLRRIVVRRLPQLIESIRSEWREQIDALAKMRAKMVEAMGEDAVREWERRQGKSLQSDGSQFGV